MTRDEIIKWARDTCGYSERMTKDLLDAFDAGAAATREECAALCDRFQARDVGMQPAECAAAIRARREKGTTA